MATIDIGNIDDPILFVTCPKCRHNYAVVNSIPGFKPVLGEPYPLIETNEHFNITQGPMRDFNCRQCGPLPVPVSSITSVYLKGMSGLMVRYIYHLSAAIQSDQVDQAPHKRQRQTMDDEEQQQQASPSEMK